MRDLFARSHSDFPHVKPGALLARAGLKKRKAVSYANASMHFVLQSSFLPILSICQLEASQSGKE